MIEQSETTLPVVTFRLAEHRYALLIWDVIEVAAMVSVTPIPDAQPALLGMVNRHGSILPVLDLRRAFNLTEAPITVATLFIVVEHNQQRAGLVVDEVYQVKYIERSALKSTQGTGRFITQVASDGGEILQLVDLPAILNVYITPIEQS